MFVEDVRQALYASKIVAYTQGLDEIVAGATFYNWNIDLGAVARIWRGGCIIRAVFLNRITEAYDGAAERPESLRSHCTSRKPLPEFRIRGAG